MDYLHRREAPGLYILFSVGGGKLEPLVNNGFVVDRRDHREKCKSISIYKEKT